VAVDTFVAASAQVTDSAGNTYRLVASEPGVYLFGATGTTSLPVGGTVTVTVSGDSYGASVVADEWSGLSLALDGTASGSMGVPSPITTSYTTSAPGSVLFFLASGGTVTASVSPSGVTSEQVLGGVSGVTAYEQVAPGTTNLAMSWTSGGANRSWMAVALRGSVSSPQAPVTYQVYESANGGAYSPVPAADGGTTIATSTTVSGLVSGVSYRFEVRATDNYGDTGPASAPSAAISP
jgi:hypothetical protein